MQPLIPEPPGKGERVGLLCFLAATLAVVVWALVVCWCEGAPAPLPRPAPKPKAPPPLAWVDVVGTGTYTWSGHDCPCTLYLDGAIVATYCGEQWVGRWRLEGDALTVEDGRAGEGACMTWTAHLRRGRPPERRVLYWVGGSAPDDFVLRRD